MPDNGSYDKYLTRREADLLIKENSDSHDRMEEEIETMKKRLDEIEHFRWKVAGGFAMLAFLASLFGDVLWKALGGR